MTKDRAEIDLIITKYDLLFEQRLTRNETICAELTNDISEIRNNFRDIRSDMKEMRGDFRWLFGIMLGCFAALFGMMAHGFHWII